MRRARTSNELGFSIQNKTNAGSFLVQQYTRDAVDGGYVKLS